MRHLTSPEKVIFAVTASCLGVFVASTALRPPGSYLAWADLWLYCAVGLGAAALCAGRARRDPARRSAWLAFTVGLLGSVGGDIAYAVLSLNGAIPYPSVADGLYLSYYPAMYVGLVLLLRAAVPRFLASTWFDVIAGALGAAALAYLLVFDTLIDVSGGRVAVVITNLAYPVGDLVLLVVAAAAVSAMGWRSGRGWWLLIASLLTTAGADIVYALQVSAGTYTAGTALDAVWPVSSVLLALSAVSLPPSRKTQVQVWWSALLTPGLFTLSSVVLLTNADGPGVGSYLATGAILAASARAVLTFREVSALAETRRQARTDDLTGLPNRRAFNAGLAQALTPPAAGNVAVLLVDLDRFKEINDALGHYVGDELLRLVGPRISGCLREEDLLARLGGDEFAVVLTDTSRESAESIARRMMEELTRPFSLADISLHVGASIGVATSTEGSTNAAVLLQHADVAMYDAKSRGGGYAHYDADEDQHSRERLLTIEQLRTAIDSQQLVLHYQPKLELTTGRVVGVEALVRWEHPTRGLLTPEHFLPLAEQTRLMRPLTGWVLGEAVSQAAAWRRKGWDLPVAVNVSASDLLDTALPLQIARLLHEQGLPAHWLELEVTESTMMADPARAQVVVDNLQQLGVKVAVDDYGTGHSSLAYLRNLSVSQLKLDRSFIQDLDLDDRSSAIVRSTIDLAHALGLTMVAEGVEDDRAEGVLAALGCDVAQGYHYSEPVPVDELEHWLSDGYVSAGEAETAG